MPIYEFRCQECQGVSEFHLKLSETYPSDCPLCQSGKLQKIMSLPSFQLKGGGWYADSYSGKAKKAESSSAESSPTAGSSEAKKTDTPPSSSGSGDSG